MKKILIIIYMKVASGEVLCLRKFSLFVVAAA